MAVSFDPYHKWLGIPPEDQPPDHYRLLGLTALESDPETIEAAVNQRMAHLRTYQTGKYGAVSQKLLNEVAAAKVCLLNAAKKAAYDERLRTKLGANAAAVANAPAGFDVDGLLGRSAAAPTEHAHPQAAAKKGLSRQTWILSGAGAAAGLLLLIVATVAFLSRGNREPAPSANTVTSPPAIVPSPPQPSDKPLQVAPEPKSTPAIAAAGEDVKPGATVSPVAASQAVDLVALADPAKHTATGQWVIQPSGLAVRSSFCALIQFPVIPAGSFELETEFTRLQGDGCVALLFPVGDSFVHVEVSGFRGLYSGMGCINGESDNLPSNPTRRPSSISSNVRHKLAVRVEPSADKQVMISETFDGSELFRWQGAVSALSGSPFWRMRRPATLGLGADMAAVVFHTARLRMLDGQARGPNGQPLVAAGTSDSKSQTATSATAGPVSPATSGRTARRQVLDARCPGVTSLAFSPDGALLAAAHRDDKVRVWDVATGNIMHVLSAVRNTGSLGFDAKNSLLSASGDFSSVRVWELATERERWHAGADSRQIWVKIAPQPDGSLFASFASDTMSIVIREAKAGTVLRSFGQVRLGAGATCLVFSADGSMLAVGDLYGVRVWNPARGELIRDLAARSNGTRHAAFSADGKFLVSSHDSVGVHCWDLATGNVRWSQPALNGVAAFGPWSPLVAAKSAAKGISFWNAATGHLEKTWSDVPAFDSLVMDPNGTLLACASGRTSAIHLLPIAQESAGPAPAPPLATVSKPDVPQLTVKVEGGQLEPKTISAPAIFPRAEKPSRVPVPNAEAQKKSLATLDEMYHFQRVTTSAAQVKLAKELLELAENSKAKPDEQFAVLRKVAELACEAGDADLLLQAADWIAAAFEVDAIAMKGKLLARLAEGAADAARIKGFVAAADRIIAQDLAADRYEAAEAASALAERIALKPAGKPFRKEVLNRHLQIQRLWKQWEPVQEALQTLKSHPDDAEANLAVGRWYCLNKEDWEKGLPGLAKGGDSELCRAAQADLKSPAGAAARLELADAWWDLAANAQGAEQGALRRRAGHWYKQLSGEATSGLLGMKIQKRLGQIEQK